MPFSRNENDKGALRAGISRDGVHPKDRGYELMAPVIAAANEKTLGR